jgi:hypothetical protein
VGGPPSPEEPASPVPAKVVMTPSRPTRRTRLFQASAISRFPSASTASRSGLFRPASVAGPPPSSCLRRTLEGKRRPDYWPPRFFGRALLCALLERLLRLVSSPRRPSGVRRGTRQRLGAALESIRETSRAGRRARRLSSACPTCATTTGRTRSSRSTPSRTGVSTSCAEEPVGSPVSRSAGNASRWRGARWRSGDSFRSHVPTLQGSESLSRSASRGEAVPRFRAFRGGTTEDARLKQHQREQPVHFGLVRHQRNQRLSETDRLCEDVKI